MKPWLKCLHWVLNVVLAIATLTCFYFAIWGKGPSVDAVSRVMTGLCGTGLGFLTYSFTRYTITGG